MLRVYDPLEVYIDTTTRATYGDLPLEAGVVIVRLSELRQHVQNMSGEKIMRVLCRSTVR